MKCIRCGGDTMTSSKICSSCMKAWADMRTLVYIACESRYGMVCERNLPLFQAQTKRLEKIWRKDIQKFNEELKKLEL